MKPEMKKLIIANLPYLLFVYLFGKLGQTYRLAAGADLSEKLLHLADGFSLAFESAAPSFHLFDLAVGVAGAVALRLMVYCKSKNAKKYRRGVEYGSARWGGPKDIAPYIDPVFDNNILLTQTERLTMNNRPKDPKTARNKNVLVIGGSGSGKTRFFVKPNLMQCVSKDYPTSFVITDPKGSLIGEVGQLLVRCGYRVKVLNTINFSKSMRYTGRLKNNYLGYTSGTVTGVVGEGTAEQLLPESYIYYNVDIQTTDKKSFQAVVDDINKELNIHELDTSYNIVYLNALGISYTANSEDANDKGFSFMTVAGILVGSLILLAAGLVIYNILKISVSKRIKGYGTLRAIGGEKGQLYQIIVIEVILLCLMGIPIGMLLGFLSARGILEAATGLVSPELFLVQDASELKTLIAENSSLNGTLLVLSGAITLAFALFAALPAARSAARVSPIMAMSGTNLKIRRRKRKTKKIHNFEAYYARLNLKRNKGRTAITILSLVMSITVFIALQGFSSLLNAASALQDNHLGDYQITNESVGFTTDDLNTLRKNEAVQSVAAIQFSLYEQNENGLLDEISLEFQLKPGETFQVVGLNDEYWDYFMGDQLPEEQLGQLKSGNACIVRNPIPMSYGEDVLEFTNIEAGENICVAGMELNVLKTLDGYDGYLGIGNGGFTNGVQVIVDDAIYERLTGKDTYSEFLPTLNEGADRENFDTFIEAFCNRIPGTTFLSYEETDQQLKESFAQIQMLAWGLILFVGLIGILNIINTVYTNIHTRVTEIGMQRAIGMSAGSLYKTFLWEGAYYGIIASVIGSVLGYVCTIFIEAATSDTIQLVAIPVMPILEATLLAVGACLLATAIPLRKISKMNIVDSIETVE